MEKEIRKEIFEIENPADQSGCLVSIFKYITLWVVGFFFVWIVILWSGFDGAFDYAGIISALASIAVTGYLLNKALNQSEKIYKIEFDDAAKAITLYAGNMFDGKNTVNTIPYSSFSTSIAVKPIFKSISPTLKKLGAESDKLSQNRVINLYQLDRKINTIDVDLTPWCRHDSIEVLLEKLNKISPKE